jgi:hypothetical protein
MTKKLRLRPEIIKRLKDIKEHPERIISHEEMMKRLNTVSSIPKTTSLIEYLKERRDNKI